MGLSRDEAAFQLYSCISRSPYIEFLFLHSSRFGVRVDELSFELSKDDANAEYSLRALSSDDSSDIQLWAELSESSIANAVQNGKPVEEVLIRTGNRGQTLHPRVEQLLLRCFDVPPFPLADREDIIYASLFGFASPEIVWQSANSPLRVLYYPNGESGGVAVSLGLSDPGYSERRENDSQSATYELVLKSHESAVIREFASWVQYVEESKQHLLLGNWLEFGEESSIPGTDVYGFLVVPSFFSPQQFPVVNQLATWHELVPVDKLKLAAAKENNVFEIANLVRAGRNQ